MQERKVPHLKGMIHIFLDPEAQNFCMTFYVCYIGSNNLSYHTEDLVKTEITSTVGYGRTIGIIYFFFSFWPRLVHVWRSKDEGSMFLFALILEIQVENY